MSEIDLIEQQFQVIGDADTTALATGAVAELLKGVGGLAAGVQKKKEDEGKMKDSQGKAAAAQNARLEANIAAQKAASEPGFGPLHEDAARKDAAARTLESAAGMTSMVPYNSPGQLQPSSGNWFKKMSGPLPNYGWILVTVGAAAAIGTVVHFARKR